MRLPFTKKVFNLTHILSKVIEKNTLDSWSEILQCYLHAVVHRKGYDETAFHKICNVTHSLLAIHMKRCDDQIAFHKMCNATHILSVIEKNTLNSCSAILQCYSHTVDHKMIWSETAFHNVTHSLLVIWKDVMRLPFTKCAMSLTRCWSKEEIWWDYLWQNVQCHSLAFGHRKRCDEAAFHKMCNVTHSLLVIGTDGMKLFTNVHCHSQAMGHRKICDETSFQQICNVTHFLSWWYVGKYVMSLLRLPFTKCVMSLTSCWS